MSQVGSAAASAPAAAGAASESPKTSSARCATSTGDRTGMGGAGVAGSLAPIPDALAAGVEELAPRGLPATTTVLGCGAVTGFGCA
jgi:hypothetical protein